MLVSTSSLSDQELYHQQQQKIVELENQLQKLKQLDSYSLQSAHLLQHIDHPNSTVNKSFRFFFFFFSNSFVFRFHRNAIQFYLYKYKNVKSPPKKIFLFLLENRFDLLRNTDATTREIKTENS